MTTHHTPSHQPPQPTTTSQQNTRGPTSKHQQSPGQSTSQSQSFPKPRLRSQALTHASAARSLSRSSRREVHVTRERTQSKRITNPNIDASQEPPHRRGIEFEHTVITQAVTHSLSPLIATSFKHAFTIDRKKKQTEKGEGDWRTQTRNMHIGQISHISHRYRHDNVIADLEKRVI